MLRLAAPAILRGQSSLFAVPVRVALATRCEAQMIGQLQRELLVEGLQGGAPLLEGSASTIQAGAGTGFVR